MLAGDLRDLAGGNRHVHDRVDAVARIDDVAVLDQEIERRVLRLQRLGGMADRQHDDRQGRDAGDSRERREETASSTYEAHYLSGAT